MAWYLACRWRNASILAAPGQVPDAAAFYAVSLPMDFFMELRAHAARRLWRSLNGRAPGPDFRTMPTQLRRFHILSPRRNESGSHSAPGKPSPPPKLADKSSATTKFGTRARLRLKSPRNIFALSSNRFAPFRPSAFQSF
ncbi:DUF2285 domain-containing protein [Bradyrhizobium sp. NAS80.1]|uniref:DNA -binding domain-containing protein n=1 Tax=Bradyrhizobium sp. NAS80.1 TaxID=1680159 RepID=UPI0032DF5C90